LHLLNRHLEASEAYRKLLVRDARSEELLGNAISLAIAQGDHESLALYADRLIEVNPNSAVAQEGAALAAFARRDFASALRFCTALVEAHPEHFAGWFNCGVALQKLGEFEKSAGAFTRAVALEPLSAEAQLSLGTVLQELDRPEAASEAYQNALALDPACRIARWNLALLCEARNDLLQAEQHHSRLTEQYPDAQDAWFRLGYVRLQLEDYPGCLEAFEACLAHPRKCPEAMLNMGVAHWNMRNIDLAKETFRQCLASAAKGQALRCLAAIALRQQDFEQALVLHRQLLELDESDAGLLYNIALLSQKRGRAADAVRYYRQALAANPDFPQAQVNLGHALMALGKHEEAQSIWQSAVQGSAELAEQFLV
jgi:tetratricopeptide (TPR) repeat protein